MVLLCHLPLHPVMELILEMQAVRATRCSPRSHVCRDPTGSLGGTGCAPNPSISEPGHVLKAPLTGAVAGVAPSSPSKYQAGCSLSTTPRDIRDAHTWITHSEKLRPPSTGSFKQAEAIDRGKTSLNEAPGSGATNNGLPKWSPPQSTLDHRAAAGDFATHAGLECRLTLPHGTRGHKRPRLDDKLQEVTDKACIFVATHTSLIHGVSLCLCAQQPPVTLNVASYCMLSQHKHSNSTA